MFNLIVNNGSSSKKYSLYNDEELLFSVHYERIIKNFVKTEKQGEEEVEIEIDTDLFNRAFSDFVLEIIKKGFIKSEEDIDRIGLRIVAPGDFFQEHHLVDKYFMELFEDRKRLSPLHIYPVQNEMSEIMDTMPNIKLYAISDSAFHKTKPEYANIYSYPKSLTKDLELYRFGYHGLSASSIVERLKRDNNLPEKLIVCHFGGGSSLTAIKNGMSIDNTMGYSPLEGLPMATRIGNADPNSLFAVMEEKDFDIYEMQNFLYKECGFKGISGLSGDTRVILKEDEEGDEDAKLSIDYYAYEIKKNIGAYKTILGGLDMIVFTGTIGNRSAAVRERICDGLEHEGIVINKTKNKLTIKNEDNISDAESKVSVLVLKTDEMGEMNRILQTF